MTNEKFTNIIKTCDKNEIARQLQKLGYMFCNSDRKLGKVGIVTLIDAITQETEDFIDGESKHLYKGDICGTVKGYENYEFVIVSVFDVKPSEDPFDSEEIAMQTEMNIWAKEIKK